MEIQSHNTTIQSNVAADGDVVIATVVTSCTVASWAGVVSCTTNKKYVISNPRSYKISSTYHIRLLVTNDKSRN